MVELARRAHPGLRFTVGSMTELPLDDDELGGILAYYSVHHTPPESLPVVFAEFRRTLAPGGRLMITAGYVGAGERLRPTQAYGGHRCPSSPSCCRRTGLPGCWSRRGSSSPRGWCSPARNRT